MDANGHAEPLLRRTSKPLVGILGDVEGRIVPIAPPPVLNLASEIRLATAAVGSPLIGASGDTDGLSDGAARSGEIGAMAKWLVPRRPAAGRLSQRSSGTVAYHM
jgi:hypothetical protein